MTHIAALMSGSRRGPSRPSRIGLVVGVVASLAAVLAVAGCSGGAAVDEPEPVEEAETAAAPVSPEVGTWETEPIALDRFLRTLEDAGFRQYARQFQTQEGWLPEREAILSLELRDGSWTAYYAFDGEAPSVFDRQRYEVVDDHFELTSDVGGTILQPIFEDEALALDFVSSTEPDYEGVPVEAILRVWYTTAPFRRTAP